MIQKLVFLCLIQFIGCDKPKDVRLEKKDYAIQHLEAAKFCKANNFNTDYYFLVDLSLHSGKNRFFVCDLKTNKIANRGLATHGSCDILEDNDSKWEKVKFNNTDNSHCSAKGKYKIGKRDWSAWGIKIKYWLHGLEQTNNNSVQRVIVLHSWDKVHNSEIYPKFSPLSWGCPAVSDEFMALLDEKLQRSEKPVLLWIVE